MLSWFGTAVPTSLFIILEVIFFLIALVVAPPNRRPSSALAWIVVIVVLPLIGIALFVLIGSPKLPAGRRAKQQRMSDLITETTARAQAERSASEPGWFDSLVTLNRNTGAFPLVSGNIGRLLPDFPGQIDALVAGIDGAEKFVHVEFYILALDDSTEPVFRALEAAIARGVTVKVLLDHLGSRGYPGYRSATNELDRIGARWRLMLPVQPLRGHYQRPDLRNHRKLVVIDGTRGFMGSLNLIDPSYQSRANERRGLAWKDLLVEVHGPIVQELQGVFTTDWFSETGELPETGSLDTDTMTTSPEAFSAQITPSGPAYDSENNLALFTSLLYAAERRVSITSPYFVPDESLLAALVTAARRGVEVELFVGEIGDQFFVFHAQHSYYRDLLAAGVRIHLYRAPTILHAKHMSVDDDVCVVGSSNMDIRSFQLDFEVMMLICGRDFTDRLRALEDDYRAASTELTLADWDGRGRVHAFVDNLARLTSAVQ
ncbi:cardiolipin synthase [Frondihabitans sp. PhB188]|uniref:cardiolipin synthase n=1 Tax=Frondihabitans sp. PhB188 TaxID=2485200 RepID=UPI000F49B98F|nr:cardiolipin synthase [Frondihabitans sp. PhB188]ROQ31043.1 cardiolipin synthase [Frondihabitans sp. PhB188]